MSTTKPTPIKSAPGVRRDGTQFDGQEYTDALWCRFYRGRPRKIGGYRAVVSTLPEIIRGMNSYTADAVNYYALGGASTLTQIQTNSNGDFSAKNDRTPAGFASSPDNLWGMDTFYSAIGAVNNLVAQAAPNLSDISSVQETPVYAGDVTATGALVATGMDNNSGGVVAIRPYLFGYGTNGRIDVSAANDFSTNDSTFEAGDKIVKGLPLRGGGGGPAGIFWSLSSVIRASFNSSILSGIPFSFDTLSDDSSILSSQGVLEYDGIFFWMGVDRFLMFNGVVREVPNPMNLDFFFDNINFTWRQKAFAFKIPRRGEIWFCAPLGNATECNHAVIYNVRESLWYDTALPGTGRSLGYFAKVFQKPLMTDLVIDPVGGGYTLWQHETGVDQINGSSVQPIRSYFTTDEKNMLDSAIDKALRVDIVEPDLKLTGALTVTVTGRSNARSTDLESSSTSIPDISTSSDDQVVRFKKNYRLMRFTFESNTVGGDYYMGKTLAHIEPTDGRMTQ